MGMRESRLATSPRTSIFSELFNINLFHSAANCILVEHRFISFLHLWIASAYTSEFFITSKYYSTYVRPILLHLTSSSTSLIFVTSN
jgi:hypothetical protein